ncbi:MAG: class I SAM-dependent methyltransferase [bacterium]|nr:class I SAM-dependent methyltransferase [bacterium]
MNRWDERYTREGFYYGRTPNYFVAEQVAVLDPGRGLYLAEGEGRNAVFAAGLGHQVTAVDSSPVGRRKALELAADRGVQLTYQVADITQHPWWEQQWDHIVLCFAHLPPNPMLEVHRRCVASLTDAGTLILSSFSKAQFGRDSGGPPDLDLLQDLEELKSQFAGLEVEHAQEREVDLSESGGHGGLAMVNEFVASKS